MKEINPLKVGDVVDDLVCEGKVKRKNNTYKYVMRCKKVWQSERNVIFNNQKT